MSYRVLRLEAENIKKLKAIDITPDGHVVEITGKNKNGKTSVLDCIWMAVGGKEAIPGVPIRKGQDKAKITVSLGDKAIELVVKRTFTAAGGTQVLVESPEGARFPSPQAMMDGIANALSFDPMAFARMDPRLQAAELRRVVKLEVDIDELDGLNKLDYDQRTLVNRDAKQKRAQANGHKLPPPTHGERVDASALIDAMQQAGATNADIETRKQRRVAATERLAELDGRVTSYREDAKAKTKAADSEFIAARGRAKTALDEGIERLQREHEAAIARAAEAHERGCTDAASVAASAELADKEATELRERLNGAEVLPEPIDVTQLRQQIDAADKTNAAIDAYTTAKAERDADEAAATALEKQSKELTAAIDGREKQKADAIKNAAMPVEGLGFADGIVTYNGLPFDQASASEQVRVSMAIVMSANPKLRVVRITDGSLLDDDSRALVEQMARDADFQVWIEAVDSSGKVGIVIEDGSVKSTPESRGQLELGAA